MSPNILHFKFINYQSSVIRLIRITLKYLFLFKIKYETSSKNSLTKNDSRRVTPTFKGP